MNKKYKFFPAAAFLLALFGAAFLSGAGLALAQTMFLNGALVKSAAEPEVFLIENGLKRHVESPAAFAANGFSWANVQIVDQAALDAFPEGAGIGLPAGPASPASQGGQVLGQSGLANGTLVKTAQRPEVFRIENGIKRHIDSPETFANNGFKWEDIQTVDPAILDSVPEGDEIKGRVLGEGTSNSGKNNQITVPVADATKEAQAKAGIVITGGVSGPGYPTGPLNLVVSATQLFLDRVGQVKDGEVKDRQYENPLETIPPTMAVLPVTINGVANIANEIKVISNIKTKNGVGQHTGTIAVDIDTIPAGHVILTYTGTATVVGSTITSSGTFKTTDVTGIFAGLVAEGMYSMTIIESGQVFGSPVTVSITTTSQ